MSLEPVGLGNIARNISGKYYGQTAHSQAFKNFSSLHFTENQTLPELV